MLSQMTIQNANYFALLFIFNKEFWLVHELYLLRFSSHICNPTTTLQYMYNSLKNNVLKMVGTSFNRNWFYAMHNRKGYTKYYKLHPCLPNTWNHKSNSKCYSMIRYPNACCSSHVQNQLKIELSSGSHPKRPPELYSHSIIIIIVCSYEFAWNLRHSIFR